MPLLVGPALALATSLVATGVKKGLDANRIRKLANGIVGEAKARYESARQALERDRENTDRALKRLGRLKVRVFQDQIAHLVESVRKARSRLHGFNVTLSVKEQRQYERDVEISIEIGSGLGKGTIGGALASLGAYGAVGAWATASTGTAIGTLSGAAATNATLAWLGGGALSAGGFGMAGGMVALGGIALAPALAIAGLVMAKHSEKSLTEAQKYAAKVDEAIAKFALAHTQMAAIRENAKELTGVIKNVAALFDKVKVATPRNQEKFARMVLVGKNLKKLLDVQILDKGGAAVDPLSSRYQGLLEVVGKGVRE